MITVEGLSKSYGRQTLFDSISFKVNRRERVGVVGRNGHGKTTLFRIIAGLETADTGTVTSPRNYRIGYVEQRLEFTEETVLDEAVKALPPAEKNNIWKAEKVLAGLGFEKDDLEKRPSELSGGYQVRLNLTKILLADFQMLLLDEPSNYLDITSIRWLERYLVNWPGEVMLITHDRSFMDKVVTHVLGIHRQKVRKIAGDTGKYYAQVAMEEEIYEKTRINDERKRKEMDLFINRFRAKARLANLVQSRIKCLEKMEKKEKLAEIKDLEFAFTEKPSHHKYAMDVSGVTFGYEQEKSLIRDFSISIGARDSIFVIGKNGRGKTTLLKLMAGFLQPRAGEITCPQSVAAGYYEQTNVSSLSDSNTVLEEVASADLEVEPVKARQISGSMMFEGEDALKRIKVLSGGEKSRVMLAKLIATPVNFLLLDEPTNHLDMASSDALLEALDNFDGAVVMVTHNEMFLEALADRLIVFDGGELFVYEGGYRRFLEKVGWKDEAEREPRRKRDNGEGRAKLTPRELRKFRSEIIAERSRILRPLETRTAEIETSTEERDARLKEMNEALIAASLAKDGARVVELSKAMHEAKSAVDRLLEELETLTAEYEDKKAFFEERLNSLDNETVVQKDENPDDGERSGAVPTGQGDRFRHPQ